MRLLVVLIGHHALLVQSRNPLPGSLGRLQVRFGHRHGRLRLLLLQAHRARVELGKHLALVHPVALVHVNPGDAATYLGPHVCHTPRFHLARVGQGLFDRLHGHGHDTNPGCSAGSSVLVPAATATTRDSQQNADSHEGRQPNRDLLSTENLAQHFLHPCVLTVRTPQIVQRESFTFNIQNADGALDLHSSH